MRQVVALALILAAGLLLSGAFTGPTAPPDADLSRRTAIVVGAERSSPAVVAVGAVERFVRGTQRGNMIIDPEVVSHQVPYLGSGVIVDGDQGLVITNNHVIQGLSDLLITLPDGRQLEAQLVGTDPSNDICLLRIDTGNPLPEVTLGRSGDLMTGEWVLAIGNPFGNYIDNPQPTVTVGVVSALHRDFHDPRSGRVYLDMIQTDASINPGNSGGALVNAHGELVGINTFIISTSGSSADIGFAIPVDRIRRVVDDLVRFGGVRAAYQDFRTWTFRPRTAEQLSREWIPGAIVTEIDLNGPAAQAGLQAGDVITRVNGRAVGDREALQDYLFTFRVGEPIELTVQRADGEHTVSYELVEDRH